MTPPQCRCTQTSNSATSPEVTTRGRALAAEGVRTDEERAGIPVALTWQQRQECGVGRRGRHERRGSFILANHQHVFEPGSGRGHVTPSAAAHRQTNAGRDDAAGGVITAYMNGGNALWLVLCSQHRRQRQQAVRQRPCLHGHGCGSRQRGQHHRADLQPWGATPPSAPKWGMCHRLPVTLLNSWVWKELQVLDVRGLSRVRIQRGAAAPRACPNVLQGLLAQHALQLGDFRSGRCQLGCRYHCLTSRDGGQCSCRSSLRYWNSRLAATPSAAEPPARRSYRVCRCAAPGLMFRPSTSACGAGLSKITFTDSVCLVIFIVLFLSQR